MRVGYILKMYPRFSETFIVNEILAHEAAGLAVTIFSLRSPVDGRFHEEYARVLAPVIYVNPKASKALDLWETLRQGASRYPALLSLLRAEPDLQMDDLYQALLIAPLVIEQEINLLHAHFGSVSTSVARLVSRLTGIPYCFTAHAKDIFHEEVDPADLRRKLQDAGRVITVSDYNIEYLQDLYGDAATNVVRIYNGLDLTRFAYAEPLERARRIVAVGRLIEKKGFGDLIEACAILHQRAVDFQCEIIGDGQLATALQGQIDRHGLTAQVTLLGPRPQSLVAHHVQQGALFAAPCVVGGDGNRDGLPTVLLEAMALGTPCVSTGVTGIPEVLADGKTGLMVPERDPLALANAMQQLLEQPLLRVQLARAARQLIETNFASSANAVAIRRHYAHIAGQQATELAREEV